MDSFDPHVFQRMLGKPELDIVLQPPGWQLVNAIDGEELLAHCNGADVIRTSGNLLVTVAVVGVNRTKESQAGLSGGFLEVCCPGLIGSDFALVLVALLGN